MWCNQCRQDVPGVGSADGDQFRCPRCSQTLCAAAASGQEAEGQSQTPCGEYDGWEFDQQLQHIERVLGEKKGTEEKHECHCQQTYDQEVTRLDAPHLGPSPGHLRPTGNPARLPDPAPPRPQSALAALAWVALSLGTMTLVCGGILLGWSVVTNRSELWTIGLPVAIGGQIALLVGLILQLERLWHDSRRAAARLKAVDEQLHDLKTTTTLLGTGHATPGGAFYAHMADGARPQLLLTDLKGQLDLLALKISNEE